MNERADAAVGEYVTELQSREPIEDCVPEPKTLGELEYDAFAASHDAADRGLNA